MFTLVLSLLLYPVPRPDEANITEADLQGAWLAEWGTIRQGMHFDAEFGYGSLEYGGGDRKSVV